MCYAAHRALSWILGKLDRGYYLIGLGGQGLRFFDDGYGDLEKTLRLVEYKGGCPVARADEECGLACLMIIIWHIPLDSTVNGRSIECGLGLAGVALVCTIDQHAVDGADIGEREASGYVKYVLRGRFCTEAPATDMNPRLTQPHCQCVTGTWVVQATRPISPGRRARTQHIGRCFCRCQLCWRLLPIDDALPVSFWGALAGFRTRLFRRRVLRRGDSQGYAE